MTTFGQAAVDRIARVVQIPRAPTSEARSLNALEFVRQMAACELKSELDRLEIDSMISWYGDDVEPVLRFVCFAGLVELGVQCGYLRLADWDGAAVLEGTLRDFRAARQAVQAVDLQLVDSLISRFDTPSPNSRSSRAAAFDDFESYLALTRRVRGDVGVRRFLEETSDRRVPSGDWSALVSPRHFAEAFAAGTIEGVKVTDVSAGYRLLGYLEWLADILESLEECPEVRTGIVLHARWAGGAERIQRRFDLWVEQMRGWDLASRETWEDARWSAYSQRIFGWLASEQRRLGRQSVDTEPQAPQESAAVGSAQQTASERIEQLRAEGRVGAARELALRNALEEVAREPPPGRTEDWLSWAEALVVECKRLAELGGPAAAAALVAPTVPQLVSRHGRSGLRLVADAQALLSRARAGERERADQPGSQEAPRSSERATRSEPREEKPSYKRVGESS